MEESYEPLKTLADGTVDFLPNRLNRQPVVVMGLTADELMFVGATSVAIGFAIGIVLAIVFSKIAMVPTAGLFFGALGIVTGGRLMRRLKRGRPDEWFYRNLQWRLTNRMPSIAGWFGGRYLILRSGIWFHRRGAK